MDNKSKKVAAILKGRRQQKEQKKVPGGEGPFNPVHVSKKGEESTESPNQYAHRVSEAHYRVTPSTLGKSTLGAMEIRHSTQKGSGNQTMRKGKRYNYSNIRQKVIEKVMNRNTTENNTTTEKDLGRPDTGGPEETVTVNPKLPQLKGQLK